MIFLLVLIYLKDQNSLMINSPAATNMLAVADSLTDPKVWSRATYHRAPSCSGEEIVLHFFCFWVYEVHRSNGSAFLGLWHTDGQFVGNIYGFIWISCRYSKDTLLRSAVGKTHDLQSDLWWTIPLRILLDHFGILSTFKGPSRGVPSR